MKAVVGLILLVVLFVAVDSLRIVCDETSCANKQCDNSVTAESCVGVYKPEGGVCGCCPTCERYLAEGESCIPVTLGLMGAHIVPCESPLVCSANGICEYPHKSVNQI